MKKSLLIFIALISLVACSQRPVFTFEVITPMPAASYTPRVEGTQTAPAVTSQTPFSPLTPSVLKKPADFSPVLYGGNFNGTNSFLLLGGVSQDDWLAPDVSVARFAGEATYSLHNLAYEYKYFVWGTAPEFSPVCKSYSVSTEAGLEEAGMVAVLDGWTITKRPATQLSTDGEFYEQAVLDWLAAEGVADPQLGDLQIFQVDLEGDGTDEIFITATHLDKSQHTTKAGDYSIVLMRKVKGDEAETVFLTGDVYRSQELEITFPKTYSLANFVDLNQDGVLEVIVGIEKWEGFGAAVYQVQDQAVTPALSAGCGL